MAARSSRSVALLSAPGTLEGIEPRLRRAGVRLVRVAAVRPVRRPLAEWRAELDRGPAPDTLVVTSRAGVASGVVPWRRSGGRFSPSLEAWAVGPGTAESLRRAGVRRVHRPREIGADALAEGLRRPTPRRIVYLRSDAAGPSLARALRRQGHRVVDIVTYRLEVPPTLARRARQAIVGADLLIATSPSGLVGLRRRLGDPSFEPLARHARLVVLGERSRQAARALGFRNVSVAPSTTAQRFTRYLLRELDHAGA